MCRAAGSVVAGVPAAGSAGGRLWRQSLHLSALLSSVSWRDDKCNHQENNIILYLPRLYQVPYLPCAVQQDSGIFRSGMEFLILKKYIFLKKLVKWQQWHLWQFAHMLQNILNLQIYWYLQCFSDFTMELWRAFFCTRIIACEKTKCYNFFMQIVRIITHELQIGIGVLVEKNTSCHWIWFSAVLLQYQNADSLIWDHAKKILMSTKNICLWIVNSH